MAFLDDLIKASSFLNQQVSQLQMNRTIDQANQLVQQVKASEADERQQRAQLQQISNALVTDLARVGAPSDTIKLISGAVGPQALPSANELISQGVLFGDEKALQQGQAIQEQMVRPDLIKMQADYGFKAQLEAMKAGAQPGQPLSDSAIQKISDLEETQVHAASMLEKVIQNEDFVGPAVGRAPELYDQIFNPARADFRAQVGRFFDAYRKAITGAQASEKELELLEKNVPTVKDRPEVFKRKIRTLIEIGDRVKRRYLHTQRKAGRDVSGFEQDVQQIDQRLGPERGSTAPGFNLNQFIRTAPVIKRR